MRKHLELIHISDLMLEIKKRALGVALGFIVSFCIIFGLLFLLEPKYKAFATFKSVSAIIGNPALDPPNFSISAFHLV